MLPLLQGLEQQVLAGDLWLRKGLSARDRSLVTLAAVIARQDTAMLAQEINRGLDNGLSAPELAEVVAHLGFYTGWGNAIQAGNTLEAIFSQRGIPVADLPGLDVTLLALDLPAEHARVAAVESAVGHAQFPALVDYTTDVLFNHLWLRPALAPRDRSLITFSALVAKGQVGQIGFHLGKALDNGLQPAEASEAIAQLAFYAGWPCAMSAVAVVKQVFSQRG